jgi:hypothetical protein
VQKTHLAALQLHGDISTWWANCTATHPTDYQVSWTEFCSAFHAHHIPAGVMRKKHQKFMDLKQGEWTMHDYSKLFNHLAQYAPDQVDTDDKKKDRFTVGLSNKLQERMTLNTGGSFLEFVSNVIIANDAIHAHKEAEKWKAVAALSDGHPSRYRMVYHHSPTYQPHQQQWAFRPAQYQHQ